MVKGLKALKTELFRKPLFDNERIVIYKNFAFLINQHNNIVFYMPNPAPMLRHFSIGYLLNLDNSFQSTNFIGALESTSKRMAIAELKSRYPQWKNNIPFKA